MRSLIFLVAAVLFLGGLFFVGVWDNHSESAAPSLLYGSVGSDMTLQFVNNPAPVSEITMEDLDGRQISSRDWQGKATIVNFWATWCAPCLEEIPDLIQLQDRYPDHLQIVGVSMDEGPVEEVKAFVREHGMNYPVVMTTPELQRSFPGVFALPTSFILDPEVRTVQKHVGLVNPNVFEQATRVLAGLPTDVTVENVKDTGQVFLSNAAQATEIPGVDLSALSPEQRTAALRRLNEDSCACGCQLTLAQCRINDTMCDISLPMAQRVVEEIAKSEL